jgi:hypothetical protein
MPPALPVPRPPTLEELLRRHVNQTAVTLCAAGFAAIDEQAEALKKQIVRWLSPPKKRPRQ